MKRSDAERQESVRRISRRGLMVGGGMAGFMGLLVGRMRYLQIEEAAKYRLLAEENRINIRLIAPPRGLIYDANGTKLAENEQNYRIVVVREDAGDLDALVKKLGELITLEPAGLERALREVRRRPAFVPVTLADRLSWDEVSRVAVNLPALPGITPEVGLSRGYPLKGDFAHVLGYVGPVSMKDLQNPEDQDPLLQIPDFQIGKIGVEAKMEKVLRGSAGQKRVEVNAVGRVMRELGRDDGTPGEDVFITIDHKLQNFMQARMQGESAAAVLIDLDNGEIKAIGSAPTFDPNLFVRGISTKDYSALRDNDHRPLFNKSVTGVYPPGSTFKLVTALAALENKVVGLDETVWCPGYIQLGRRRFHCWKHWGHGHVALHDAIVQSCDVYFYEMAQRLGIDKIAAMAHKMGLGERHDLPMSAISEGLIPTVAWKEKRRGEVWVTGDTLNAAIGQGDVLSSPLQLAVMVARIASGKALQPHLVKAVGKGKNDFPEAQALDIDPGILRAVRKGMYGVCNELHGTARAARISMKGMEMAGKTGSSQVRNIGAAERAAGVTKNEDLPWNLRDHALFVSFAPYDHPRFACAVLVEHGMHGGSAAAPIARDVLLQALYDGLPPLDAYPSNVRDEIRVMQDQLDLLPQTRNGPSSTSGRA